MTGDRALTGEQVPTGASMLTGGRVRSKDGTEISYLSLGAGHTLLCTHGAFSSGAEWLPVARLMRRSPRNWAEIVAGAPMMLRHWDMSLAFPKPAEFGSLRIPALLIHGSRSEERPFKHSTRVLAEVLPDADLEVIEGHNHVSMSRDPEPVATRIRAWLDQTGGETS
jgi:pimeloyl-ACP methyl ester carboxylesterase